MIEISKTFSNRRNVFKYWSCSMTSRNQQINSPSSFSLSFGTCWVGLLFLYITHGTTHGRESISHCLAGNNHFVQVTRCRLWTFIFFAAATTGLSYMCSVLPSLYCLRTERSSVFFAVQPAANNNSLLQMMRSHFSPSFISSMLSWVFLLLASMESDEISMSRWANDETQMIIFTLHAPPPLVQHNRAAFKTAFAKTNYEPSRG